MRNLDSNVADGEAGGQKATATCDATFEEVGKQTCTKGEKEQENGVCLVGDGCEKAMRSQKGSCWMQKLGPPVGLSFGSDL